MIDDLDKSMNALQEFNNLMTPVQARSFSDLAGKEAVPQSPVIKRQRSLKGHHPHTPVSKYEVILAHCVFKLTVPNRTAPKYI